jgi:hypothetical protein
MIRRVLICFIFILFCYGCYRDECNWQFNEQTRSEEYLWYCNHELFSGVESVQLIGKLQSSISKDIHHINRKCQVYNDTIYVQKRQISPLHKMYDGQIIINNEKYVMRIELN